jgi:hypothetical protein
VEKVQADPDAMLHTLWQRVGFSVCQHPFQTNHDLPTKWTFLSQQHAGTYNDSRETTVDVVSLDPFNKSLKRLGGI